MKILQVTYRVPFPPTDGGAIGIYTISKGLHDNGAEIDLIAINTPKHAQPHDTMKGIATQHDVFVNTNISLFKLVKNLLFSKIPYNVERFYDLKVKELMRKLLAQNEYDYIHVEGAFTSTYIPYIKSLSKATVVVRAHNIEYVIWERLSINEKNFVKRWYFSSLAKRLKAFETKYYGLADGIAAITKEDKDRLLAMGVKKPITVIPVGMMLDKYKDFPLVEEEPNSIFSLSALDWMPNIEGLNWFLKEVWPQALQANPSLKLHIAGKSTPDWLMQLNMPNVVVHGFVDDAFRFKKSYQLMLVPLLSGGGMRVKIVEGLAAGKCILSTSIGAEGIAYEHGKNMVIADSPQEWVQAILHYTSHQADRHNMEKEARTLALKAYENVEVTKHYLKFAKELKGA